MVGQHARTKAVSEVSPFRFEVNKKKNILPHFHISPANWRSVEHPRQKSHAFLAARMPENSPIVKAGSLTRAADSSRTSACAEMQ
jgi:hypothetical protein